MRLIKRIVADTRGLNSSKQEAEQIINAGLIELQQDGAEILHVREINKDSGVTIVLVLYEDGIAPQKNGASRS